MCVLAAPRSGAPSEARSAKRGPCPSNFWEHVEPKARRRAKIAKDKRLQPDSPGNPRSEAEGLPALVRASCSEEEEADIPSEAREEADDILAAAGEGQARSSRRQINLLKQFNRQSRLNCFNKQFNDYAT